MHMTVGWQRHGHESIMPDPQLVGLAAHRVATMPASRLKCLLSLFGKSVPWVALLGPQRGVVPLVAADRDEPVRSSRECAEHLPEWEEGGVHLRSTPARLLVGVRGLHFHPAAKCRVLNESGEAAQRSLGWSGGPSIYRRCRFEGVRFKLLGGYTMDAATFEDRCSTGAVSSVASGGTAPELDGGRRNWLRSVALDIRRRASSGEAGSRRFERTSRRVRASGSRCENA